MSPPRDDGRLSGSPAEANLAKGLAGSVIRYNGSNGALFATATETALDIEFRGVSGLLVDRYTIGK